MKVLILWSLATEHCEGGDESVDKTVATFQKNKFQEVRIGIREFKGNDLVDIRTWTMTQGSNEMVPTAKGVTINVHLLPELKKALDDVEKILKENMMI
jgi:hypothetical protein